MRHRRPGYQAVNNPSNKNEDCSWNSIIVWGICISVCVLIILYLAFGPNLYHPPPVLVGPETVSLLTDEKKQITVYEDTINVNGNDIFYRYTEARGNGKHIQPDVLILHGAKYGSQTWKGLGTLQIFSFWGYRTFAVDLPGYKLSKKAIPPCTKDSPCSNNDGYIDFMDELCDKLSLKKVVLIVPSMSGIYGLPILLQSSNVDIVGFIAIAPQGTPKFKKEQYQKVQIPTMMLWGEKDRTPYKEESLYWMQNIPEIESVMVPKGEHAAFVGNPEQFHREILKFMVTNCKIGEDENFGFGEDTTGNDFYDQDNGYFAGYDTYDNGNGNVNGDTTTDTYTNGVGGDTTYNGYDGDNYEDILANYFDKDNDIDSVYYDDTELYFDNINNIGAPEMDDLKDETEDTVN